MATSSDRAPVGGSHSKVAVTTSATLLLAENTKRAGFSISRAPGTIATVYLGNSNVSASTHGFVMAAGGSFIASGEDTPTDAIYGIASVGSVDIAVWEWTQQ